MPRLFLTKTLPYWVLTLHSSPPSWHPSSSIGLGSCCWCASATRSPRGTGPSPGSASHWPSGPSSWSAPPSWSGTRTPGFGGWSFLLGSWSAWGPAPSSSRSRGHGGTYHPPPGRDFSSFIKGRCFCFYLTCPSWIQARQGKPERNLSQMSCTIFSPRFFLKCQTVFFSYLSSLDT